MSRIHTTVLGAGTLALTLALAACSNGQKTSNTQSTDAPRRQASTKTDADLRTNQCPLSHKELGEKPATRTFAGNEILFRTESEAATFDELPGERKRVVAGRQVLARRGVANETCIITKDPLPIDAFIVDISGVSIGFKTASHRDQYDAIPSEVREDLVAPYLVRASGIANIHCPVTGEVIHLDCPTVLRYGVIIAMAHPEAMKEFEAADPNRRNEIIALVVLPSRGISNTVCPVTNKPLRLDSPVIHVDGQLVGVRNVKAAREFNKMSIDRQRDTISEDL